MQYNDNLKERLYRSKNPDEVSKFYDLFPDRDALINWMKSRPASKAKITTFEGNTDVVVVIPTIDVKGEFAQRCINEIYTGLYIVIVESGYNDYLFNIARNSNLGIIEALKVNPKWIILSSDDMIEAEPIQILIDQLSKLNHNAIDVLFTSPPGRIHSLHGFLGKPRFTYKFLINIMNRYRRKLYELNVKYNGKNYVTPVSTSNLLNRILYLKVMDVIWTIDFSIFSSTYLKRFSQNFFDEIYINAHEDADLSIRMALNGARKAFVKFEIRNYFGGSMGRGFDRSLRSIPSNSYLNYKFENGLFLHNFPDAMK